MTRRPIPGFKCTFQPAIPLRGNVGSDNRARARMCPYACMYVCAWQS